MDPHMTNQGIVAEINLAIGTTGVVSNDFSTSW
jgi:hypothetical protein